MRIFLVFALLLGQRLMVGQLTRTQPSQEGQRIRSLEDDAVRSVKASIRIDREVYFPSEEAIIEIEVTNTSDSPLEIINPFDKVSSGLSIYRVVKTAAGQEGFDSLLPHPARGSYSERNMPPTMVLGPRQSTKVKFSAPGECGAAPYEFGKYCLVPEVAGHYAWLFAYVGAAFARFEVYNPVVVEVAEVALREPNVPGVPHPHEATGPRKSRAILVRDRDGKTQLLISLMPTTRVHHLVKGEPLTIDGIHALGYVRRIPEAGADLSNIRLQEDPRLDGRLIITVNDGNVFNRTIRLDEKYNKVEKD